MKLQEYPDNWGPTIEHMLNNQAGFNASDFEFASGLARSVGDDLFAELLLNIAARRAAEHLVTWGHCG
jgi:hypothetical protein